MQVTEVAAQLSRPVNGSWGSLGPGTTAILSSITLPEKQEAEVNSEDKDGGKSETDRKKTSAAQIGIYDTSIYWMIKIWAHTL